MAEYGASWVVEYVQDNKKAVLPAEGDAPILRPLTFLDNKSDRNIYIWSARWSPRQRTGRCSTNRAHLRLVAIKCDLPK